MSTENKQRQEQLEELLAARATYHRLEEFQRSLFIVKWLDKAVSKCERALAGEGEHA
jgi:hypothetical protein